jgi:hypothetical protein
VSFLGETTSELRRMIGIDLRTVRLAIAALGRGRVPGNRLRSDVIIHILLEKRARWARKDYDKAGSFKAQHG